MISQTLYQDWFLQEYSCYWENKIMQLKLNQSVQAVFKSVSESIFKFIFKSVYESVYKFTSESAAEFVEWKKQLQLSASKQSLLIIAEFVFFI